MNRLIKFLIRGKKKLTEEQRIVEDLGIQQAIRQFHQNLDNISETLDAMDETLEKFEKPMDDFDELVEELRRTASYQEAVVRQRILEGGVINRLPKELVSQRKHKGL